MEHSKKKSIWTKDFTYITVAVVLSAIGGEAMNLPVSLLVFEETQSTFLSAIVMVCGMLPDIVLPIFVAPLIDKGDKKKWIVGLDGLLVFIYAVMGIWINGHEFSYGLYLAFVLAVGTISVFYRLAYSAWYPDLIPAGLEQKGYAVSGTIYPTVIVIMSPVVTFIYGKVSMGNLFLAVAAVTFISVLVESRIKSTRKNGQEVYTFRQYLEDMKEGFRYMRKEKGIRNIYTYMSIANGASGGVNIITQAYYQTQPWLTVTMLGFLKSAEMIGRVLSGLFQYKKEIPQEKRYAFTKGVYLFYDAMDSVLLFMPYPLMLLNRFLCGGLGTGSATIRETAVQSYLPEGMRARVNALFSVIFSIGGIAFQLLAGILGQLMPYRYAALFIGILTLLSVFLFIILPAKENRPVYEAVREAAS